MINLTLPMHSAIALYLETGVTDFISLSLVTLRANRTCVSEECCCYVSLQRYERYRDAVKSSVYHRATIKCTCKVIRQTYNLKLLTVLLFIEFNTTMALAILMEQRDFVSAGVSQICGYETSEGRQI